jgi:hypothetical protein
MATKALVQLEPETMRLYAFTIEAVTGQIESSLLTPEKLEQVLGKGLNGDLDAATRQKVIQVLIQNFDPQPTVGGRGAGGIMRDLAANMRAGADKAEAEFTSRLGSREERKQRRLNRQGGPGGSTGGGRKGRDFAGADFPGSEEFFGTAGYTGGGGGQLPPGAPGTPPLNSAAPAQATILPPQGPVQAPGLAMPSQAPAPPAGESVATKEFVDDSIE